MIKNIQTQREKKDLFSAERMSFVTNLCFGVLNHDNIVTNVDNYADSHPLA